jgi:energy-coupling factor transporter ATP-binding protein EcfA2
MENRSFLVDIGRCGEERISFDLYKETGLGFAGYSGTGKTNLVLKILSTILEHKKEIDIHLFDLKQGKLYKKYKDNFESVLEHETKINKIRVSLNKLSKEVERRIKKLEKSKLNLTDYLATLSDIEKLKWSEKIVVVDCASVIFAKLRAKSDLSQFNKFIEIMEIISKDGSKVGIIPIYVFMRNANSEAPLQIVNNISLLGSFSNPETDHIRWDLLTEGTKFPKKNGELLIKTHEYVGFVKTYSIESSISNKEGLFKSWDPYRT